MDHRLACSSSESAIFQPKRQDSSTVRYMKQSLIRKPTFSIAKYNKVPRQAKETNNYAVMLLLLLAGCQTTMPTVTTDPAKKTTVSKVIADPRIDILLVKAELALKKDQLTTPLDDNAYYRFLQVLSIDPQNLAAEQGIAEIVETYLAWAIQKADSGQIRGAQDYLNRARSVDENHPNIPSVANKIQRYLSGGHKVYSFQQRDILSKKDSTVTQLRVIAKIITKKQAYIVIEAPSDSMGRWIYQQINRVSQERVRARFELASKVNVHLYYDK